jgi:hypothetical protein
VGVLGWPRLDTPCFLSFHSPLRVSTSLNFILSTVGGGILAFAAFGQTLFSILIKFTLPDAVKSCIKAFRNAQSLL